MNTRKPVLLQIPRYNSEHQFLGAKPFTRNVPYQRWCVFAKAFPILTGRAVAWLEIMKQACTPMEIYLSANHYKSFICIKVYVYVIQMFPNMLCHCNEWWMSQDSRQVHLYKSKASLLFCKSVRVLWINHTLRVKKAVRRIPYEIQ